jgi:outer membrane lipoprotein-sorting protein
MTSLAVRPACTAALAAMLLVSIATGTGAQKVDDALDRATKTYAGVKTLRGTIDQTLRNLLSGREYQTKAEISQRFPDRISIRFTDPKGDMLVADGTVVWSYSPSDNPGVVVRAPLSSAQTWVNLIGLVMESPRSRFIVSDGGRATLAGQETQGVALVPRQPMEELVKATVWIEDETGIIRQIEVHDGMQTRRILFTSLELNAKVDEALFRFRIPPGVRVEDVR